MKIDPIELYTLRVLVFLETDAQSNKYNQVCLTAKQFKKMSDAISTELPEDKTLKKEFRNYETLLSEEEYELPDLQEIYEEEMV